MYKQLAASFIFLLVIACTFFIIYRMSKPRDSRFPSKKAALHIVFLGYLCAVLTVTIIPLRMTMNKAHLASHFNFIPVIRSYKRFFWMRSFHNPHYAWNYFQNLFGNIALFVPFGFFLPLLYPKMHFGKVVLIAALSSSLIEFIQYLNMFLGYYRYVDIDDVLLNTFGAMLGFWTFKILANAGRNTGI